MAHGDINDVIKNVLIEIQGSSAYSNDRNRPYDGQPHTDDGERGKTLVAGLTMRDVKDCIIKGFLLSSGGEDMGNGAIYERAEKGTWVADDVYKIKNFDRIDPIAVVQNATCEMERMMGIFPNVPPLKFAEGGIV